MTRRPSRLAAGLLVTYLALLIATLWAARGHHEFAGTVVVGVWLTSIAFVGALIAARRSSNPIGWLLLATAITIQAGLLSRDYAHRVLVRGTGTLPLGEAMAWLSLWLTIPGFALLVYVFLLFPRGHLPSRRWRWPARLVAMGVALSSLTLAFKPGPIDGLPGVRNPVGAEWSPALQPYVEALQFPFALFVVAVIGSLFLRAWGSEGDERHQVRWVAYAAALLPTLFLGGQVLEAVIDTGPGAYVLFLTVMVGLLAIPISIGVAILKHRLYDIDLLINRTLVYGALVAGLGLGYVVVVVVLQQVFSALTRDSDLAIAGSTLAVAAAFRPARAGTQRFIDRRFYRSKYDAAKVVESFSSRVRDEVDLDQLTLHLVQVVRETMQPRRVSLWLRPSDAVGARETQR